jgi:uncharacterized protein YdeI (BOF family)
MQLLRDSDVSGRCQPGHHRGWGQRVGVGTALIAAAVWAAGAALAEYVGPFPTATAVVRVVQQPVNDQLVVVRGLLVRRLGLELYQLRDDTGEIAVEIDPELFPRAQVKAETPVEVRGRVETGWRGGPRIEAHDLVVLPAPREKAAKEAPAADAPAATTDPR